MSAGAGSETPSSASSGSGTSPPGIRVGNRFYPPSSTVLGPDGEPIEDVFVAGDAYAKQKNLVAEDLSELPASAYESREAAPASALSRTASASVTPKEIYRVINPFFKNFTEDFPETLTYFYTCDPASVARSKSLGAKPSFFPKYPREKFNHAEPPEYPGLDCPEDARILNRDRAIGFMRLLIFEITPSKFYNDMASIISFKMKNKDSVGDYYEIRENLVKKYPLRDFSRERYRSSWKASAEMSDILKEIREKQAERLEVLRSKELDDMRKAAKIEAGDIPSPMRALIASIQAKIKARAGAATDEEAAATERPGKRARTSEEGGRRRKTRAKKPRVRKTVKRRRRNSLLRRR